MLIGIMGAMTEEVELLLGQIKKPVTKSIGGRTYYRGSIKDKDIVVVMSRWGKVASASTATTLINCFNVDSIIFSGVAGAIAPQINIGDIVVADELIQYDLGATPLSKKYEVPLLGISHFKTDRKLRQILTDSAEKFIHSDIADVIETGVLIDFGITGPAVHTGLIVSGDQFISGSGPADNLRKELADVKCAEMEGAAVAQVCYEYNVPFAVIRTISDRADENAHIDFQKFISKVAGRYCLAVVTEALERI